MLFQAAALLGLVISIAIVLALVERRSGGCSTSSSAGCGPRGGSRGANEFDLLTIFAGTVMVAVIAMLVATPLGLGRGGLPVRVRDPADAADPQADPGDAGQHPERGPGVLRAAGDQPGPRAARSSRRPAPSTSWRPGSPSGSSRSRWWPRSPRTRCTPSRTRCARRAYGIGARRMTVTTSGRVPGGGLGHRGLADPRLLAGARGDDGRRDRGRRDRGRARTSTPRTAGRR